jgi:cellobiose phosphorylase
MAGVLALMMARLAYCMILPLRLDGLGRLGALEAILGLRPAGDTLRVDSCIPAGWPGYEVTHHRSATYRIKVENPTGAGRGVRSVTVDWQPMWDEVVPLRDDGQTHDVQVVLG